MAHSRYLLVEGKGFGVVGTYTDHSTKDVAGVRRGMPIETLKRIDQEDVCEDERADHESIVAEDDGTLEIVSLDVEERNHGVAAQNKRMV